jgi:hypothetical protein
LRLWPRETKHRSTASGPFVYRLGRQVFNLKRGVRLPYGLPLFSCKFDILMFLPNSSATFEDEIFHFCSDT